MGIRSLKPVTPGSRFATRPDFADITTDKPEKSLTTALRKSGGRNNKGRITMRRRGGGHRRRYRIIDFKRNKFDIPAKVATIEYDPNRSAYIALFNARQFPVFNSTFSPETISSPTFNPAGARMYLFSPST